MKDYKLNIPRDKIKEKLTNIVIDKLGLNGHEFNIRTKLTDVGMDSLDAVELLMEVEKEFNVQISDEDADKIHCIADMIEHLFPLKKLRKEKLDKLYDNTD